MNRKNFACACILLFLGTGCRPEQTELTAAPSAEPMPLVDAISGVVLDEVNQPVPDAVVRVKTTDLETVSAEDGSFKLYGLAPEETAYVTAWKSGHYIAGVETAGGSANVKILLPRHASEDNPDYQWLSAYSSAGEEGNCQNCHADSSDAKAFLPFTEWQQDGHALSVQNNRFLSMYTGQDLDGNQSPLTQYGYNRDYGRFPLRPDLNKPYFGPGYKLDFPDTDGNCSACHAPVAAVNDAYGVDPQNVAGVGAEGVACDFCHKIWGVKLAQNGLPYPNMPGVLSLEFRRPPKGHQFFAGPLDDVAPGEDTYSPLQQQSQFCAACHFGVFWDTQIYNSFGEWLESPYSDPDTGKTCQDCHMAPIGMTYFAISEAGGQVRDPSTIFSHRMPGATDEVLLQNAVTMKVNVRRGDNKVIVDVSITNDQTGHHVPTDSPLRQMILLVRAKGSDGKALRLLEGSVVPEWGGVGSPENGYYAGLPGRGYAKILQELWTEVTPTSAYWNPTRVISDNRIAAYESDTTSYIFDAPADPAEIYVTLIFRRAFKELSVQKGWNVQDIVMEEYKGTVP